MATVTIPKASALTLRNTIASHDRLLDIVLQSNTLVVNGILIEAMQNERSVTGVTRLKTLRKGPFCAAQRALVYFFGSNAAYTSALY